jgi:hypothetical protein
LCSSKRRPAVIPTSLVPSSRFVAAACENTGRGGERLL